MESKVRKGIGLVAHDAMKKDLIEWVLWNSELLMGNKFYCTGTTGTLILEALKEKHPDDFIGIAVHDEIMRVDEYIEGITPKVRGFPIAIVNR